MNKKLHRYSLIMLICTYSLICKAQVNDAGLWLQLAVKKNITQSATVQLGQGLRFNENITELGSAFTELGLSYKLFPRFTVEAFYRFGQKRKVEDWYSLRHRYYIDLSYKIKIKQLSFTLRERYQTTYKDIGGSENGGIPQHYLRSKLMLKYNLEKKYTPFIAAEAYYQIGNWVDKLRFSGGFDYEFNKHNSIQLYYMINKEVQVKNPLTSYIIGINYTYNF